MVKVNSQIGKTRSLTFPINGDFWEGLEGRRNARLPGIQEERGSNTSDIKKKKKSQWFKQFEVDRLKKVLLLSKEIFPTGSSKTLHWLIPQIFLKS